MPMHIVDMGNVNMDRGTGEWKLISSEAISLFWKNFNQNFAISPCLRVWALTFWLMSASLDQSVMIDVKILLLYENAKKTAVPESRFD